MKVYVNRRILGGFFVSMVIILSLGLGSYVFMRELIAVSRQGAIAQQVLFISERIRAQNTEVQAALWRLAAADQGQPARTSIRAIRGVSDLIHQMDSLTAQNPSQREHLTQLTRLAEWQVQTVTKIESAPDPRAEARDLLMTSRNAETAAAFDSLLGKIQDEANLIRKGQQASVTTHFYQFAFAFGGLMLAGLAVPMVLAFVLNQNLKKRAIADEKLRQASAMIHDLYEKAPCGYFSIDQLGMFTNVNETFLQWLGYNREQVVDRFHFTDLVTPKVAETYDKDFNQLKQEGYIRDVESRLVRKDKTVMPVMINATAITDSNNKYLNSRCTVYDITERKKAEGESRRLTAELESFSYSVSHDLRAPLRSINGFAKILVEDYGSKMDVEGTRVIGKIVSNASRMGQLIDDLLDFSRIVKKEINKSEIDTREFVSSIARELLDMEKGREIELDIKAIENCKADASMIRQVWVNLVTNALKYSRKQKVTRIEIGSETSPEEIVYYIKDNGVGFDMKFMDKLFGVFQRLHRAEDFEGTGVGLALVKRIVERHNGRIWADAKVNKGASFYFALPKT